jgi:hypothetical protein
MFREEFRSLKAISIIIFLTSLIIVYYIVSSLEPVPESNSEVGTLIDVIEKFKNTNNYNSFIKDLVPQQYEIAKNIQLRNVNKLIAELEDNGLIIVCNTECINNFVESTMFIEASPLNITNSTTVEELESAISTLDLKIAGIAAYDLSEIDFDKLKGEFITLSGVMSLELKPHAHNSVIVPFINVSKSKDEQEEGPIGFKVTLGYNPIPLRPDFLRENFEIIRDNWSKVRKFSLEDLQGWALIYRYRINLIKDKNILNFPFESTAIALMAPLIIIFLAAIQFIFIIHTGFKIFKHLEDYSDYSSSIWMGSIHYSISFFFYALLNVLPSCIALATIYKFLDKALIGSFWNFLLLMLGFYGGSLFSIYVINRKLKNEFTRSKA